MSSQSNENRPFSNIKVPEIPDWVDTEHPDFPKYYSIAILDEKGEPKMWWGEATKTHESTTTVLSLCKSYRSKS